MPARLVVTLGSALCLWAAMVSSSLAIGCTASQRAACAKLSTSGADSCVQWSCVPQQRPAGYPAGYSCVQTLAPAGTQCHSDQACIHSGACGATGACVPGHNQQQICQDTSTGAADQMQCYCVNYSCQARMANGKLYGGAVSRMCKATTGP